VPTPIVRKGKESFYQDDSANKVDILVIDDNSQSMDTEQSKMSQRWDSFTSYIRDVDYHIGITTTDLSGERFSTNGDLVNYEGTSIKVMTPTTPNAATLFKNTITRKETIGCGYREVDPGCPSTVEEPLRATMLSIDKRATTNAGFFRDKVDLVVVILSDEDEMSNGPAEATRPQAVVDHFKAVFGQTKRLMVHGIIVKPGDSQCLSDQWWQSLFGAGANYGNLISQLVGLTGGTTQSICDADFSQSLTSISASVRRLVGTFELVGDPAPGTVKVTLTPAAAITWKVEGKKVIFDTPPPAGTQVDVTYDLK
jgi:hypothetical protein